MALAIFIDTDDVSKKTNNKIRCYKNTYIVKIDLKIMKEKKHAEWLEIFKSKY